MWKRAITGVMLLAVVGSAGRAEVLGYRFGKGSVEAKTSEGALRLELVGDQIVHVQFAPDEKALATSRASLAVLPQALGEGATSDEAGRLSLKTPKLQVTIDKQSGWVAFQDADGKPVLAELPGGRRFEPAEVQGEKTFHPRQLWQAPSDESLYGLGQHQFGLVDIKGYDLELWQRNTSIAVPMLVSSKGYGILWDNPSYTKFGDPRDFVAIPAARLFDDEEFPGNLTLTTFSDTAFTTPANKTRVETVDVSPATLSGRDAKSIQGMRWEGSIYAKVRGEYQFRLYSNGGTKMWIDDKLVADHWRQNWLAEYDIVKVSLGDSSMHKIKIEWNRDKGQGTVCRLTWKPLPEMKDNQAGTTSLWSQVGEKIDYYYIGGGTVPGSLDRVLAGYRQLTGRAPMMPVWAFGLWQSRQRYETQAASLDVVKGFRERKIPFDTIVQDWFYWPENAWGSHQFDAKRFPDPEGWVKEIHAQHARVMLSVWGKFYPTTENARALDTIEGLYPVDPTQKDWVGKGYLYTFYDAFNAKARELFWSQVRDQLLGKGFDAWWMDATEPDIVQPSPPTLEKQLARMPRAGDTTGARVLNAYPLLNSQAVYEGQRQAQPDKRPFILTRSGYAGQQRYAAASWSGDISSTWTAMRKQVAAGVGYSLSGLPYWTMDAGGFAVPAKFASRNPTPEAVDEWRELNTRWFQFAAFTPLLRVHGEFPYREMWQFGGDESDTFKAMLKFDELRYRLLPYVYTLAGDVTRNNGTFMRPLAMDFPVDAQARTLTDQYLFGHAFLVSPVTEYKARSRGVYLPAAAGGWYDFWTGRQARGGQTLNCAAPYDLMPLHVRAGSIVPFGPALQYTTEKPADPLTLHVYTGTDGDFSLYEDDGLTFGYERGEFSRIPMSWNEKGAALTLGKREGQFPGMLRQRQVRVLFVSPTKSVGYTPEGAADQTVFYAGDPVVIRFSRP